MPEIKDMTKIRTYKDFVARLQEIEEQNFDIVLSFYKYCYKQNEGMSLKDA